MPPALLTLAALVPLAPLALVLTRPAFMDALGAGPGVATAALVALLGGAALASPFAATWITPSSRSVATAGVTLALALAGVAIARGQLEALALLAVAGAATGVLATLLPVLAERLGGVVGLGALRAAESAGAAVAGLLVLAILHAGGLTWHSLLMAIALSTLMAGALAMRSSEGAPGLTSRKDRAAVGLGESVWRIVSVPTARRLVLANLALGLGTVPLALYVVDYLQERWAVGRGGRAGELVLAGLLGAILVRAVVPRASAPVDDVGQVRLLERAASTTAAGSVALMVGVNVPVFIPMIVLVGAGMAALLAVRPAADLALLGTVPVSLRPLASALGSAAYLTTAALSGLALLDGIDRRFGPGGAVVVVGVIGLLGALLIRSAAATLVADLVRLRADEDDAAEVERLRAAGARPPLLACQRISFSYGQLQVLFGVDFTVDEGEMVALLGTNGAGKSTLLRVISGLALPSAGTVRFRGADVTFLTAERRTQLGISQVPGGRGIYGPMTVLENLRVISYTLGRDRRAVDAAVDATFEAFPRLGERRHQVASTLSGGEQQMLNLARALVVRSQLLLVDELSLGLAPKVVGELLECVRVINDRGTAVVIVEQSVNLALSLVDDAYFMEKGQIRFDGRASELLARPDLLRSVFLDGATRAGSLS